MSTDLLKQYFPDSVVLKNFIRNKNFNPEYLNTSFETSKELVSFLTNFNKDTDMTYVEIGSGLGISAILAGKHKNIKDLILFEFESNTRDMLIHNLKEYKISDYNIINEDTFTRVPQDIYGQRKKVVIVINFKNMINYKITNEEFNEIIDNNPRASIILVINKPEEYSYDNPDSIEYGEQDFDKDTTMTYIIHKKKLQEIKDSIGVFSKSEMLTIDDSVKFKIDIDIPKEFYKPNGHIYSEYDGDYKKWKTNLKNFLQKKVLPITGLPADKIKIITDDESMKVWETVFTGDTVDTVNNYETLETVGDFTMSSVYVYFISEARPDLNSNKITNFKKRLLSTKSQSLIALALGFRPYIRSKIPIVDATFEDVLEAFFGALIKLGNKKFVTYGWSLCFNLFHEILQNMLEIDYDYELKDPKTQVQQIFKKLHFNDPIEITTQNPNKTISITIKFTGKALSFIRDNMDFSSRPFIAMGTGVNKKEASTVAYGNAMRELEKMGITDEFAEKIKKERLFINPILKDLNKRVKAKILKMGFKDSRIDEKKNKSAKYIMIIGIDKNDNEEILETDIDFSKSIQKSDLYIELMNKFLRK